MEREGRARARGDAAVSQADCDVFAIVGPGLIVSNVDNDAGGIYTYAQAGRNSEIPFFGH